MEKQVSDNRTDYTQGFQAGYDYAIKAGINQGIELVLQVLEDEDFPRHGIGHIIRLVDAKKLLVPTSSRNFDTPKNSAMSS